MPKALKPEDLRNNYLNNRNDDDDDEEDDDGGHGSGIREVEVREQDRFLPIANIARIMKTELPGNAKIAKDAKESIQECVSEFISFITSEASDKCLQEKRKTINGDDLLWAMSTLGFDKYIEPLKLYLSKYRDSVKGEKPEKKPGTTPTPAAAPRKDNNSSSSSAAAHHHHSNIGNSSMNMSMNLGMGSHHLHGGNQHLMHNSNSMLPSVSNLTSSFGTPSGMMNTHAAAAQAAANMKLGSHMTGGGGVPGSMHSLHYDPHNSNNPNLNLTGSVGNGLPGMQSGLGPSGLSVGSSGVSALGGGGVGSGMHSLNMSGGPSGHPTISGMSSSLASSSAAPNSNVGGPHTSNLLVGTSSSGASNGLPIAPSLGGPGSNLTGPPAAPPASSSAHLMGGTSIEASPLYLVPGAATGAAAGGAGAGAILPPLPKKRTEVPGSSSAPLAGAADPNKKPKTT